MKVSELIQYFYYNIPISEYEVTADGFQDVFAKEKIAKEDFLKQLRSYAPGKGLDHVRNFLKNDYEFKKSSRSLEKAYKESDYSKSYPYLSCISMILYEAARAISFAEKRPAYSFEDYRRIRDHFKTDEFADAFINVYLKQKHAKTSYVQPEDDRCMYEASLLAHFAARRILFDSDYIEDYRSFLDRYSHIDERNANFPFVNEQEKQIAQQLNKKINKAEEDARQKKRPVENKTQEKTREYVIKDAMHNLRKAFLNTGKTSRDYDRIVSASTQIYENNPIVQNTTENAEDFTYGVILNETWYQNHRNGRKETILDRYINKKNISKDIGFFRQCVSDEDMKRYFSLEGYGVSFIKELGRNLFRLFDIEWEEVAELVKENEECKKAYNYLKNTSDELVLMIYYSAFDEYISNLVGSLLLNLDNRSIRRKMQDLLEDAGIVFPYCFNREFMHMTAKMNQGAIGTQGYVEEAAGIYLASYLKEPALVFSILEFPNFFIDRYIQCIVERQEVTDEEIEKEVFPIIQDFNDKKKAMQENSIKPKKGIKEAYSIYSATAKACGLNENFLWPENPLTAFQTDPEFMADFTFFYFDQYIGKKKTVDTFDFSDYFQVYAQALIYRTLIDHIFDDDNLIPPDFDLSFEENYRDLLKNEEADKEATNEMADSQELLQKIDELKAQKDKWKKETERLHNERNELNKALSSIAAKREGLEEANQKLRGEIEVLQATADRYDELKAEQLKARPEEISAFLSSFKIAISGGNNATVQKLLNKYPNMIWYEKVGDITASAGQMDYIIIMTQFNAHKMSETIEKKVGSSKTKILLVGEVRSNFELTEKIMFNKIKEEENR